MKRLSFLIILIITSSFYIFAQNKNRITGTVYDNTTKESIIQGNIRILNSKDSTFITGVATNINGQFTVNVNPGRYLVAVSYLGYAESFYNVNATKGSVALGDIFLNPEGFLLSEAVVTAKMAEIAVKGDTIEYNADSYKVQESAVVEDLLKKLPGAEVDSEGKITINGKEITKILVDGEEFFSTDPKVASKNLPAKMVEKLQVLDRKSDMARMTGFDDGDEETVINLTVRPGMKEGLFGQATGGIGNHDRYGLSGMANYMRNKNQLTVIAGSNNTNNEGFTDNAGGTFGGMRGGRMSFGGRNGITQSHNGGINFALNPSNKLKWGGNVRFGDTNNDVQSITRNEQYRRDDPKGNIFSNSNGWGENKSKNFGADFRFEWTPDTLTRIIFSPNFQYGKNDNIQSSDQLTTYSNPSDSINWGYENTYSEGDNYSTNGRLEVSRTIGKPGRVLSLSLSGGYNNLENDGTNYSETTYRKESGDSLAIRDQKYNQNNKGYNWRAFVSYVEPIGRNNFLQFTYSYRKNYSESDRKTFLNDGTNYSIIDTTSTKKLENNFVNQQIEVNFKSVREKYNYTIGVALQPSSSESWTIVPNKDDQRVSNKVLNFAPVGQFNYMWDRRHNLRINYNGRTTQPSVTQLSNIRDESNPNSIVFGNPDLKPSFRHDFRIRYQKFNPEQASAFMVFANLNLTNNAIVSDKRNISNGRSENTYANVNGNWEGNIRMIFNRPLRNKKFSVNSMSFVRNAANNAFIDFEKNTVNNLTLMEVLGLNFRSDLFDFGLRGNITYTKTTNSLDSLKSGNRSIYNYGATFNTTWYLPYDITVDTDITYSGNDGGTEGFQRDEWLWNASISKQLFKAKNGTIKFSIYDILQQRSNISQSSSDTGYRETITNTLQPYFMVSFAYRFQVFKGGASMGDMNRGGGRPGPPHGGFRGPGGPHW